MTSMVATSAVHVLEHLMKLHRCSGRGLAWAMGIHGPFIVSGVLLALMDRVGHK